MKKFDPADLKPCPHMRVLVSAYVDDGLSGIAKWYTVRHLKDCRQCQASLPFLHSLKDRLVELDVIHSANATPEELLQSIAAELAKVDHHTTVD